MIAEADSSDQILTSLNQHVTAIDLKGFTGVVVSADQAGKVTDSVSGGTYVVNDNATKIIEFYGNSETRGLINRARGSRCENASLQQAVAHFANTTTGVGALVGSYSLSSAAITSASSVPLTVEQASAAVGADNFSSPYSLTDTYSNLDSLVTGSLFSGAVEVKAVAETVAQAVAMRADIGTPDTLGGEVISYSLGANLTAGDFADLSVVELDAVLGAANSSAIQHLISVEDSVSAIETDLASAASVIVSSGLPKG